MPISWEKYRLNEYNISVELDFKFFFWGKMVLFKCWENSSKRIEHIRKNEYQKILE